MHGALPCACLEVECVADQTAANLRRPYCHVHQMDRRAKASSAADKRLQLCLVKAEIGLSIFQSHNEKSWRLLVVLRKHNSNIIQTYSLISNSFLMILKSDLSSLRYDVGGLCNGILAGVVSITAGCGNITNLSAIGAAVAWIWVKQRVAHNAEKR